ncbi:MAG: stalk domain-containing protein [Candidatus Bruticola sp.]
MLTPSVGKKQARLPIFLFLAVLAVLLAVPHTIMAASPAKVFVNGMRVDAAPVVRDGVTYLPIQVMAQALKAEIIWDSKLNTVKVNGQIASSPIYNNGGRIYLPVETFVSSMGGTVNFDGRDNRILISTGNAFKTQPSASSAAAANTYVQPNRAVVNNTASSSSGSVYTQPTKPVAKTASAPQATNIQINNSSLSRSPGFNQVGTPASYAPNQINTNVSLRPADASPYLSSNLQPGPIQGVNTLKGGSASLSTNAQRPQNGRVYVPKSAKNDVFQVTVTNLETISVLKDFYRPKEGCKYVIAYLSQQNISQQVQIYTGRFSLMDQKSNSYEYIEGLSNFWLVILRPYGINFGYLVFEVPADSKPVSLVLHSLNQAPLSIDI